MDRSFFVRSQLHRGTFCSKCGARVLSDEKVLRRHGAKKHLDMNLDNFIPIREKLDYGYRLCVKDGDLLLEICKAQMVNVPGKIGEFTGAAWEPEMQVIFPKDSSGIRLVMNETQLDPQAWLASIRAGKVCRISRESDHEVIRQVFPTIPAVYSLQMFAWLYQTRGFSGRQALTEVQERELMESLPMGSKDRLSYLRERLKAMEEYLETLEPVEEAAEDSTVQEEAELPEETELPEEAELPEETEGRPLLAKDVYSRLEECGERNFLAAYADLCFVGEEPILRIVLCQPNKKDFALLFGDGYRAWGPQLTQEMAVRLLNSRVFLDQESENAIMEYSRIYPQIRLGGCLKEAGNPFLALYGWDYHYGIGLALKEGFFQTAASCSQYTGFRKDPALYDNVADMIGIPKRWMKKRK